MLILKTYIVEENPLYPRLRNGSVLGSPSTTSRLRDVITIDPLGDNVVIIGKGAVPLTELSDSRSGLPSARLELLQRLEFWAQVRPLLYNCPLSRRPSTGEDLAKCHSVMLAQPQIPDLQVGTNVR
jgi:hypothetical protein